MKKIKKLLVIGLLFFITIHATLYFIRKSDYSIKTNGKLYIVNKLSSNIMVFDLYKGKMIAKLPIEIEPHEPINLTNKNRLVVTNYGTPDKIGNTLTVINTKTNTIEKTIDLKESKAPHGIVAFPSSNKVGVVSDLVNDLLVVNVETGIIEKRINTQQIVSHLLVLNPIKNIAYVSNINSGSVSVIDLELNKVIKIISCGLGTEGIDITPDGSEIWVTNNKENTISVIDTETYQITHNLPSGNESLRLKFSIDGKLCLVTNAKDGTISVYNQQSKKQIKTIQIRGKVTFFERLLYHTPRPVGILMHPNGLYAFVSNSNANKIEIINMKTLTLVSSIGTDRIPDGLGIVN